MESLKFFIMVQIMIIILSLTNYQTGSNLNVLGEGKEKYKTFPVQIKKQTTKIDKDGSESVVNITYRIRFIDSARIKKSSISNADNANNLAEGVHKIKCKDHIYFLEYECVNDSLIKLFILQ